MSAKNWRHMCMSPTCGAKVWGSNKFESLVRYHAVPANDDDDNDDKDDSDRGENSDNNNTMPMMMITL